MPTVNNVLKRCSTLYFLPNLTPFRQTCNYIVSNYKLGLNVCLDHEDMQKFGGLNIRYSQQRNMRSSSSSSIII
jgi:hypothetical protein